MSQAFFRPAAAAVLVGVLASGCGRKAEEAQPPPIPAVPAVIPAVIPAVAFPAPGDTLLPVDSTEPPRDTMPVHRRIAKHKVEVTPEFLPPPAPPPPPPPVEVVKPVVIPPKKDSDTVRLAPFRLSLAAPKDTLEPGRERIDFDLAIEGDTTGLQVKIDVDGDGKPEAAGNKAGHYSVAFSKSGVFSSSAKARNKHGQIAQATTSIRLNARPRLEWKAKQSRADLAEAVSFRLKASDADDSLTGARVRFDSTWEPLALPGGRATPGQKVSLYQTRAFGKVCKPWVAVCVTASDNRERCDSAQVEIFNAPPEVVADSEIHAKPGEPASLLGRARDPDGRIVKWEWDLDGDGKFEIALDKEETVRYTFAREGEFNLTLRATNAEGLTAVGQRKAKVRSKW